MSKGRFIGYAYIQSLRKNYPDLIRGPAIESIDERLHIGFVRRWVANEGIVGVDAPTRFMSLAQRALTTKRNVWLTSFDGGTEGLRRVAASSSYKGLIHFKPPSDIVLYSNLIWELQPATIIEFGALQGGSSLWFADQLDASCGHGQVHSFELLDKCIHPSAAHPRLHFHCADLRDASALDAALFERLPHPWLVVDDAHENVERLMQFVGGFLQSGDYYVLEDVLLRATPGMIAAMLSLCDTFGLLVDTKYTDAFGYNVTCSPNGWLRKS